MRTLFDQRSSAAASWRGSAAGATQSHPLRQLMSGLTDSSRSMTQPRQAAYGQ